MAEQSDNVAVIQKAEEFFSQEKWRDLLEYLQAYTETEDLELLWRVIRAHHLVGKRIPKDRQETERLVQKALEMVLRGLAINEDHFQIQKWSGLTKGWYGDTYGTKAKAAKGLEIRDHFKKATELNPNDASANHLYGRWCYNVASLTWWQRKAASVFLSDPPTSSHEEALSYLEAAEKAEPGFFSANWLFLGKTHQQLGHKEEARKWLQQVLDKDSDGPQHKESQAEAKTLLKKL